MLYGTVRATLYTQNEPLLLCRFFPTTSSQRSDFLPHAVTLEIGTIPFVIQTEQEHLLPPLFERMGSFVREGTSDSPHAIFWDVDQHMDLERALTWEFHYEPSAATALGIAAPTLPSRQIIRRRDDGSIHIESPAHDGTWDGHRHVKLTLFHNYVAEALESFLVALLPDIFLPHRICLMHASGLVSGDKAYLFTGPSGSGKTTMVRHSPGKVILSDELVAVRCDENNRVWAHGTPFFGSWGKPGVPVSAPVEAIQFLAKSQTNRMEALSPRECFRRLCGVMCYRSPSRSVVDAMLALADPMLPLCRLMHFYPSPEIWSLLEEA